MAAFFKAVFYQPLYNAFITLFDIFPWLDAGVIVIVFTVLVRLVLFPLSKKAVITQLRMKEIEPELKKIKEKYKENKEEQARKTWDLYKEKQFNPFASVLLLFIQLPIIFSLYYVFIKTGLPDINHELLYSFVKVPEKINMIFLNLVDISEKNIVLAMLAGLSTFFQAKFASPPSPKTKGGSFQEEFARGMSVQMKYVFPILVFFIAYRISGVVSLYWITSNLFTIAQEIVVKRKILPTNSQTNQKLVT